jgi:hypothetical protein
MRKTPGLIVTLNEKLFSHLVMKYIVTGTDITEAMQTRTRFDFRKDKIIVLPELPKTFLTPISFVLDRPMKSTNPNNPNAAISRVNRAKIVTIVLRFFSDE